MGQLFFLRGGLGFSAVARTACARSLMAARAKSATVMPAAVAASTIIPSSAAGRRKANLASFMVGAGGIARSVTLSGDFMA